MPRDDHPRARQARQLARKQGTRPPYERLLIVTEGTKTEPNYLEENRRKNSVPSANIKVMPSEKGTEPLQVVEFAEDTFLATRSYDRVYVVFDRDDHRTFHDALAKVANLDGKLKNREGEKPRSAEFVRLEGGNIRQNNRLAVDFGSAVRSAIFVHF